MTDNTHLAALLERVLFIREIASGYGGDEASRTDPRNALTTIVINCDEALVAAGVTVGLDGLVRRLDNEARVWRGFEAEDFQDNARVQFVSRARAETWERAAAIAREYALAETRRVLSENGGTE